MYFVSCFYYTPTHRLHNKQLLKTNKKQKKTLYLLYDYLSFKKTNAKPKKNTISWQQFHNQISKSKKEPKIDTLTH